MFYGAVLIKVYPFYTPQPYYALLQRKTLVNEQISSQSVLSILRHIPESKKTTTHGYFGLICQKKGKLQNRFECQRTKRESHLKFRSAIGHRLVTWSERPLLIGSTAHQNRISARLHFVFHCSKEGIIRTNSESRTENSISGGKLRRGSRLPPNFSHMIPGYRIPNRSQFFESAVVGA